MLRSDFRKKGRNFKSVAKKLYTLFFIRMVYFCFIKNILKVLIKIILLYAKYILKVIAIFHNTETKKSSSIFLKGALKTIKFKMLT